MNEYLKYNTCFYVFDLYLCEEPTNLVRKLDFTQNEDIVIISIKNVFKKELINVIKEHIEKYFNIKNIYNFLNLNYTFEKNAFLILIKRELYNDIDNIYYKNIKIYTRKQYGKIYRRIIKRYFNEYLEDKLNKKNISENDRDKNSNKNNYETFLYKNLIQHKINNNTYNSFINKKIPIDKEKKRINYSFLNYIERETTKKKENDVAGEVENGIENKNENQSSCYSSDYNNVGKSIIRNMRISSNYSIDKRKKIFVKKEIKEDIKRKEKYDDNSLICLTFKIKNISFCIIFSNFDFYEYLEKLDYYKYIFNNYNKKKNDNSTDHSFNYMNYYIKNYNMYCKQIYNYFINNIIFETKNEDLYLFNIDVIVFLGFDNFVLFNNEKEDFLNDNSFFVDKNIAIINKNKKNFLQKKTYFTLTREKKNRLMFIGYKIYCNLYMQIKVDIIDNFFYKHFHEIKQKNKNIIISIDPKIIDFNLINTYQIYHTQFEISYEYRENYKSESGYLNDDDTTINSDSIFDKDIHEEIHKKKRFIADGEVKGVKENEEIKKKKKKNYLSNILNRNTLKIKTSLVENKENHMNHNEKYIYDEKYFSEKSICANYINEEANMMNLQETNNSNSIKRNDIIYINDTSLNDINEEELYFSILCLDSKNNSTIPVNLYSYLHLKKNSIFKYLEENIRFKKEGKKKSLKSKSSIIYENNFEMLRHIYVYPYKGIIKKNSKKKIQLNIYVEKFLYSEIFNDSFILIVRIHNFVKDMFLTVKYSIKNNIVNFLLNNLIPNSNDINNNPYKDKKDNLSNLNMSLYNRRNNSDKNTKYDLNNIINKSSSNNINTISFFSTNFTKFIFYLFLALDNYQKDLENYKDKNIEDVFYFFRLTNLNKYHLLYSFNSVFMSLQKKKKSNSGYFSEQFPHIKNDEKKKLCNTFYIKYEIYKNIVKKYSSIPYEINYLIEKIKANEKIEKKVSIEVFLLLFEELFYILNKSMVYYNFLEIIKKLYNHKINKNKKMCIIFYTILKNCSISYKNIFLVFISFLKKLLTYFIKLSIHNFYLLVLKKINKYDILLKKKSKKYYFHLFLDSFNFFYTSFLSYISTYFLSFLDIQIALDLAHYLLFYL